MEYVSVYRLTGEYLCGGVLIQADSILTVASCLFDQSGRPFKIDEVRYFLFSNVPKLFYCLVFFYVFSALFIKNLKMCTHLVLIDSTVNTYDMYSSSAVWWQVFLKKQTMIYFVNKWLNICCSNLILSHFCPHLLVQAPYSWPYKPVSQFNVTHL